MATYETSRVPIDAGVGFPTTGLTSKPVTLKRRMQGRQGNGRQMTSKAVCSDNAQDRSCNKKGMNMEAGSC